MYSLVIYLHLLLCYYTFLAQITSPFFLLLNTLHLKIVVSSINDQYGKLKIPAHPFSYDRINSIRILFFCLHNKPHSFELILKLSVQVTLIGHSSTIVFPVARIFANYPPVLTKNLCPFQSYITLLAQSQTLINQCAHFFLLVVPAEKTQLVAKIHSISSSAYACIHCSVNISTHFYYSS